MQLNNHSLDHALLLFEARILSQNKWQITQGLWLCSGGVDNILVFTAQSGMGFLREKYFLKRIGYDNKNKIGKSVHNNPRRSHRPCYLPFGLCRSQSPGSHHDHDKLQSTGNNPTIRGTAFEMWLVLYVPLVVHSA